MVYSKCQPSPRSREKTTIADFDVDPAQFFIPGGSVDVRIYVFWRSTRYVVVVDKVTILENVLINTAGVTDETFGKRVESKGIQ